MLGQLYLRMIRSFQIPKKYLEHRSLNCSRNAALCLISASFHVGIFQKKHSVDEINNISMCTIEIVTVYSPIYFSFLGIVCAFICIRFSQSRTAVWLFSVRWFVLSLSQIHLFSPQNVVGLLIEEHFSRVACQAVVTKLFRLVVELCTMSKQTHSWHCSGAFFFFFLLFLSQVAGSRGARQPDLSIMETTRLVCVIYLKRDVL